MGVNPPEELRGKPFEERLAFFRDQGIVNILNRIFAGVEGITIHS